MDNETIKTALDNINEDYLLDAADCISEKSAVTKRVDSINAEDMTVVENYHSKPISKGIKWLSVAAVFAFAVVGVAVAGTLSGRQISVQGDMSSVVEGVGGSFRPNVDDPITSEDEQRVTEQEKARNEVSALVNTTYDGTFTLNGQKFIPGDDSTIYVEYTGGKLTIDGKVLAQIQGETPEKTSVGYYVAINGVVQELYVNDESIGKVLILEDEQIESDKFSISFTPTISEADKDMKELNMCLVQIRNPHLRVSPYYVTAGVSHNNKHDACWKLKIDNVSIENYEQAVSDGYISYEKKQVNTENNMGARIYNGEVFCEESDDGYSVSVKTSFCTNESEGNVKYRLVYLINGIPTAFADGTPYIEIDTEPCTQYIFDAVTIDGINPYDTIDVISFYCEGEVIRRVEEYDFIPTTILPKGNGR